MSSARNRRATGVRRPFVPLAILAILGGVPTALLLLSAHRVQPSNAMPGSPGPRSFSIDGERYRPARGRSDLLAALRAVSAVGEADTAPTNFVEDLLRENAYPPDVLPDGREKGAPATLPGLHPDHALRIDRESGSFLLVFGRGFPGPSLPRTLETAGWSRIPESSKGFLFLERKHDREIAIGVVDKSKGEYLFLLPAR